MTEKKDQITLNLTIPKELLDQIRENVIGETIETKVCKCLVTGYRVRKRKMPLIEG